MLSGIKAHTLRIWEQRYALLNPKRTETNIRYYDDADLKLILNVAMLNENGLKISKIAAMNLEEIRSEVMRLTERSLAYDDQTHALTIAMVEMNEERFEKILNSNIIKLGFEQTMMYVIYPFLSKIGILWQTAAINPAQEHFISNLIRQKLIVAIDGQMISSDGKKFLLFLPEGELHEISLLFTTYLIKSFGHKVIYLGQNTPISDLISVYELHQPEYLLTVATTTPAMDAVQSYVDELGGLFPDSTVLVSGFQVISQHLILPHNVQQLTQLRDIKPFLEQISRVLQEK